MNKIEAINNLMEFFFDHYDENNWKENGTKDDMGYQLKVMAELGELEAFTDGVELTLEEVWQAVEERRARG